MKNTLISFSGHSNWGNLISTILGTNNRLYIGYFGLLLFPLIALSTLVYIAGFILAPQVDIDGIREPVAGSLLYGNNIISGSLVPSSNAIGVHLLPCMGGTCILRVAVQWRIIPVCSPSLYCWSIRMDGKRMRV